MAFDSKTIPYDGINILLNVFIGFYFIHVLALLFAPFVGGVFVPRGVIGYGNKMILFLIPKIVIKQHREVGYVRKTTLVISLIFLISYNFYLYSLCTATLLSIVYILASSYYYKKYLRPKYLEATRK
jgi:hypothetical protein